MNNEQDINEMPENKKTSDVNNLPEPISRGKAIISKTTPRRRNQHVPRERFLDNVMLDKLVPFKDHTHPSYEGEYFKEMLESVRQNKVITPITVRSGPDDTYEILAGHTRVWASREVGLEDIPTFIYKDLPDEDAMLIFTETNLFQRSFNDMKHSERAALLTSFYEGVKLKSGYRSDLLEGIERQTSPQLAKRSTSMMKLGEKQGLSNDKIYRYLRIHKLIEPLKTRVDNEDLKFHTAIALSYLRSKEQEIVESRLVDNANISMKQANALKKKSKEEELDENEIIKILKPDETASKVKPVKFGGDFLAQFFRETQSPDEIRSIVQAALEQYYSNLDN